MQIDIRLSPEKSQTQNKMFIRIFYSKFAHDSTPEITDVTILQVQIHSGSNKFLSIPDGLVLLGKRIFFRLIVTPGYGDVHLT